MASYPKSSITFIKFLVFDFSSELKLPTLFAKKYEKIIPRLCTLRSHLERSCEVSIVSNRNGLFFRKGWDKFQEDNELKEGDILVFHLVDDTTFQVFVYGSTCCLKNLHLSQPLNTAKGKRKQKEPYSPEEKNIFEAKGRRKQKKPYSPDDSIFDCGEAKGKRKQKEPYSPDDNIFDHDEAKRGRKRKEPLSPDLKIFATEISDRDGAKEQRKQKEPESADVNMFDYRNAKRGRKGFEKRNNEKPVAKKMRSSEKQLQSHTAVVTLMRYQTHNVAIPRSFAIQAGLKHRNETVIEYPKGRTWSIQVWKRNDNAFLSTGWSRFVQANDISAGDTCIFRTVCGKPNFITAEIHKNL
ncbi:hypothetical protein M5689_012548 [Euphorbia peplus]|nr:hypothetical protein M5689_012548 [Euphorbia peplus]